MGWTDLWTILYGDDLLSVDYGSDSQAALSLKSLS
jgi:hypothetical protein